jgi:hypothetical protein
VRAGLFRTRPFGTQNQTQIMGRRPALQLTWRINALWVVAVGLRLNTEAAIRRNANFFELPLAIPVAHVTGNAKMLTSGANVTHSMLAITANEPSWLDFQASQKSSSKKMKIYNQIL